MKKSISLLVVLLIAVGCYLFTQHAPEHSTVSIEQGRVLITESSEPINDESEIAEVEQVVEGAAQAAPSSFTKQAIDLPQTEQQSLWTAFSEARRKIRPLTEHQQTMPENEGALYLASSPSQKIRARFLEDGVRLFSGYPGRELHCFFQFRMTFSFITGGTK